jgi:hypothetical protein
MMMRMRCPALLLCTSLALPSGAAKSQPQAAAGTSGYEKLRLTRVEAPSLNDSNATQFLAADSKGHPFLLRGDTLEVFRLGAGAAFDRRVGRLACGHLSDSAYAAAMDPTGSTWAVSSPTELALCDFVKEQRPPGLEWVVSSLTFSRSGPLVAVTGLGPPPDAAEARFKRTEPRVFGLKDDRWQPVVWGPIPELKEMPQNPMPQIKAQTDSLICTGPKDAIWLASWNSYRLERVSGSERPERQIVVGSGEVEWQKLEKKEQQDREKRDRRAQGTDLIQGSAVSSVPRGVVRALLCAPEGVLYLVVSTTNGLALDRFNPSQSALERVLLDGATVSSGPMTAALVADGLWLGGRFAADGLWRISLEDLASAHWKPVKDARIDGKPLG